MKQFAMILTCMLICFALFAGCKDKKDNDPQDLDVGNSVEIDASGISDADTEASSGAGTLPDGFVYDFKDPENADGIVVTPKE